MGITTKDLPGAERPAPDPDDERIGSGVESGDDAQVPTTTHVPEDEPVNTSGVVNAGVAAAIAEGQSPG